MRIRTGFVSNSSSSSFICDICGEDYSGWEAGLDDAEMMECTEGHTICDSEIIEFLSKYPDGKSLRLKLKALVNKHKAGDKYDMVPSLLEKINDIDSLLDEDFFYELTNYLSDCDCDFRYAIPPFLCPICMLNHIESETILKYISVKFNIDVKEIEAEIRENYTTLQQLNDKIK